MLLATPENMEKCKDIPGVVALDLDSGRTHSARRGDYFAHPKSLPIMKDCVLAVKVCKWVDPISGEDIIAQNPAENK